MAGGDACCVHLRAACRAPRSWGGDARRLGVTAADIIFDLLLVLMLTAVGLLALWHRRIFACAVFFIVFGLLLSVVWMRLSAPDVAMAEAAIGAGVTGALVIATLSRMSASGRAEKDREE